MFSIGLVISHLVTAKTLYSMFSHKYVDGKENEQQAKDLDWSGPEADCYDSFNARVHQESQNHGLVRLHSDKYPNTAPTRIGSVEEVPLDSCGAKHDR